MSLGALLTVSVVPTVYTLLARKQVPGEITEVEQVTVAQAQTSPQVVGGAGD